MEYRYVFMGHLKVGPDKHNLLTDAVKDKDYLVRIVTPGRYKTVEDAEKDDMEYEFYVFDDEPCIIGIPAHLKDKKEEGQVPLECPAIDIIDEETWSRYRMIRLPKKPIRIMETGENFLDYARPCGKAWKKIFPERGTYPIAKVAWTVIGLPNVDPESEEGVKLCRFR